MRGLWSELRLRLDALLHRNRYEEELREEFEFHVEQETRLNTAAGMPPDEARRAALRAFGGVEYQKERFRDQRGLRALEDFVQDLGLAFRSLRRQPRVAIVIGVTMALGIGVNAAVFSVINQTLLWSPEYPEADELVLIQGMNTESGQTVLSSWPDFWDLRRRTTSFESMAVFETGYENPVVTPGGSPAILTAATVGASFLDVFGVRPVFGRGFTREEHITSAPVVMISHDLWVGRFAADSTILSSEIELGGLPRRIVGVLPAGLEYPGSVDFVTPERESPPGPGEDDPQDGFGRSWRPHRVVARLAEGVALESALEELTILSRALEREHPVTNRGHAFTGAPLVGASTRPYRTGLLALWASVGLIFLIACVNIANLLLSRMIQRRQDVAVRLTLGGGRGRIVRHLLLETLVMSSVGVLGGILVGDLALRMLLSSVPVPIPGLDRVAIDWTVVAVMTTLALFAGSLVALMPAAKGTRLDLARAMRNAAVGTGTVGTRRLQTGLIVGQIALSSVLMLAAGAFAMSYLRVSQVDPGFADPGQVMSVRISVQPPKYTPWEGFRGFFTDVERAILDVPGIEAAGLSFNNPMEPGRAFMVDFDLPGGGETAAGADVTRTAAIWPVSSGFMETVGLPIIRGRGFLPSDTREASGVVIVNETFVRRFIDGPDPIGMQLTKTQFWGAPYPDAHEIVGVVRDMKADGLRNPPYPAMFFPYDQAPFGNMRLLVRTPGDVNDFAPAIREAVWSVDPAIPMERMEALDEAVGSTLATDRFIASLVSLFAVIALALSAVGLFGVMSNIVAGRSREFGIRRALGAQVPRILRSVFAEAFLTSLVGWLIGLAVFLAASRVIRRSLFETAPTDPISLATVASTLLVTAALATMIPARRAARVEPTETLKG